MAECPLLALSGHCSNAMGMSTFGGKADIAIRGPTNGTFRPNNNSDFMLSSIMRGSNTASAQVITN
jgi:hypothetical protein